MECNIAKDPASRRRSCNRLTAERVADGSVTVRIGAISLRVDADELAPALAT